MIKGIVLGVALATAALASMAAAAQPAVNPCRDDAEKFCKNTPIGAGERLACLEQHMSELSAACQAHLNQREMHRAGRRHPEDPNRAWFSACNEDLKKYCSDIPAGRGTLLRCLEKHQSTLSENCKLALSGRNQGTAR